MAVDIHPTAIVDPGAELGTDVTIGPWTIVGGRVRIGDFTRIDSCARIEGRTTIGRNNHIYHGAAIGLDPQDLKYEEEETYVEIGDGNVIREYATIHLACEEGESTVVENGNLLMAYTHVAHNCRIGSNVVLANAVNLAGYVTIHDYAIIGGLTPVHQFASIGAHSFVGGGSRISKDIPPFIKVAGSPPKVSGTNSTGLKRRGFSFEQRCLIKKAYVILYRSNLNVSQAAERIERELPQNPDIKMFVDFIRGSKRGITK
ncbi:MAG: acyl-ACP--UDP-N-acetylglucosamine O-acyltransferase [Candidatus Krumholzibacteriota bacterium]|nr:acyl-ACP--UDP-N-acetylglucosamine O-acyltransferase [Candidatus Krumholzibacteriota bacterium]